MPAARVDAVAPGSPADRAGVIVGDEVLAVNGEVVRDVIAYQIQVDGAHVELDLRRGGMERVVHVDKPDGAQLGIELSSAVFDRVRTCDNHCPFCFIHQLPKGMRKSLYLKDDDYRLSFLYGNFTTLTRFTEADLERVVSERLGPLYVSIHATDPDVRTRLLRNRRGATSLRWLELILDAGIEVHGQVVVCPGINDGAVLDDTLLGVLDRFPALTTLGVVPLGVSGHNREEEMRVHTLAEAQAVVDIVERWQARYASALGRRLVYVSDEYYLLAQRPFPPLAAYDECSQHENGIGMARTFEAEVRAALGGAEVVGTGPRSGFFAWVDGAPAEGYRAPREIAPRPIAPPEPVNGAERWNVIVTGELGAAVLESLLPELPGRVRLLPVKNGFFGGNIGVTGLLTGEDIAAALQGQPEHDRYLLPDVALSRGRFLDGTTAAVLPRTVEIVPTDGGSLVQALRRTAPIALVSS
ncbi:MAG: Fe-S oxidoreductase [Actinomycetia bacterium]|nr:Fe-S oxidoreductase [Actinomycetes bacterium]